MSDSPSDRDQHVARLWDSAAQAVRIGDDSRLFRIQQQLRRRRAHSFDYQPEQRRALISALRIATKLDDQAGIEVARTKLALLFQRTAWAARAGLLRRAQPSLAIKAETRAEYMRAWRATRPSAIKPEDAQRRAEKEAAIQRGDELLADFMALPANERRRHLASLSPEDASSLRSARSRLHVRNHRERTASRSTEVGERELPAQSEKPTSDQFSPNTFGLTEPTLGWS